ncbi:MAG: hypothetical protein R6U26_02730 [Candidatus Undinarchaeales archaeon]
MAKTVDKWKAKKSFEIVAPEMFNNKKIGVTFSDDPKKVPGRTVKVDYSEIQGRKSKRTKIKLNFMIDNLQGNTATTKFLGHNIVSDFERSLSRKGTSKVYVNQRVTLKEGKKINLKAFAITLSQVRKAKQEDVRKKLVELIKKKTEGKSLDKLMNEILTNQFGKGIKKELSKVYPMKYVIVQKTEVV